MERTEHRHAIDCPGGPLCNCGVGPIGVAVVRGRSVLPRPASVAVLRTAPQPMAIGVLPRPSAVVGTKVRGVGR